MWYIETFVFLLIWSLCLEVKSQGANKPHVLFFLADDLGWKDVQYNGASAIKTPNIDALAAEGVKLNNYYVQPLCTPTRGALLTGKYPIHIGLQHQTIGSEEPEALPILDTLPQKLRTAGYKTHMVGKWHLGFYQSQFMPTNRGFDSFYGFLSGSETYYDHKHGSPTKILDFYDDTTPVTSGISDTYSVELFVNRVTEIVANHPDDTPLFMYVSFQNVHSPTTAPDDYVNKYSASISDLTRRSYAGMVDIMDEAIGDIVTLFKQKGIWSDTITIFSSDNGGTKNHGGCNYPLRGQKGDLWEGGVRSPAFIRAKWLSDTKGTVSNKLMHVTDWYPTLLGRAGVSYSGIDGVDQWSALKFVNTASPRTEVLYNIDDAPAGTRWTKKYKGAAIRIGDYKYVENVYENQWCKCPEDGGECTGSDSNRVSLLFNLATDEKEEHPITDDAKKATLKARLDEFRNASSFVQAQDLASDQLAYTTAAANGYWGPWL